MTERQREALLARIERWTEWPQTVLALALVPILLAPHVVTLSSTTRATLDQLDYLIWGCFLARLVVVLAIAPHRGAYLRTHWLDVVLVALPMLRPFRALRAARVVRAIMATDRVLFGVRRLLVRRGLHYVLASAVVIVVAAGMLVTIFERDTNDGMIRSLSDGLWWAVATVITVGYGDTYPKTAMGRGVGVALMFVGVGLFGVITAHLAAFFIEGDNDDTAVQLRDVNKRLRRIEELLRTPGHEGVDGAR